MIDRANVGKQGVQRPGIGDIERNCFDTFANRTWLATGDNDPCATVSGLARDCRTDTAGTAEHDDGLVQ
ncbi:hypothetical protein D3C79_1061670 [compost metagenome]